MEKVGGCFVPLSERRCSFSSVIGQVTEFWQRNVKGMPIDESKFFDTGASMCFQSGSRQPLDSR
jgi:hypothetical protein